MADRRLPTNPPTRLTRSCAPRDCSTAATTAEPTITASASVGHGLGLGRRGDSEPHRERLVRQRANPPDSCGQVIGQSVPRAGHAPQGNIVYIAATPCADQGDSPVRTGRGDQEDRVNARLRHGALKFPHLLGRAVAEDQAVDPRLACRRRKMLQARTDGWDSRNSSGREGSRIAGGSAPPIPAPPAGSFRIPAPAGMRAGSPPRLPGGRRTAARQSS